MKRLAWIVLLTLGACSTGTAPDIDTVRTDSTEAPVPTDTRTNR